MPTYKLTLEYDGTAYAGWQRQPEQPTIQGEVERVLAQITQTPISVVAAGRTDAGVHARGQVVSFRSSKSLPHQKWVRAINGLLPQDITIVTMESVPDEFHARYSVFSKEYEYLIFNSPFKSALDRNRFWHIPQKLEVSAMREAAVHLKGSHDFSSFEGSPTDNENPVCAIQHFDLEQTGSNIRIRVEADRFLKQMVRAMVGTLVEVGHQKRNPSDMKAVLDSRDRCAAGQTAPPHGLYLLKVNYEKGDAGTQKL